MTEDNVARTIRIAAKKLKTMMFFFIGIPHHK
jgi:hypothetical protein